MSDSDNAYIGQCEPYDPNDNYRAAELRDLPKDGYFVRNKFATGSKKGRYRDIDYYPCAVVSLSKRHALVVERKGRKCFAYQVNYNYGVYDPTVEECSEPSEYFKPYLIATHSRQVEFDAVSTTAFLKAIAVGNNYVLVITRVQFPTPASFSVEHGQDFHRAFNDSWEVYREYVYEMKYRMTMLRAVHGKDVQVVWSKDFSDYVSYPQMLRNSVPIPHYSQIPAGRWMRTLTGLKEGTDISDLDNSHYGDIMGGAPISELINANALVASETDMFYNVGSENYWLCPAEAVYIDPDDPDSVNYALVPPSDYDPSKYYNYTSTYTGKPPHPETAYENITYALLPGAYARASVNMTSGWGSDVSRNYYNAILAQRKASNPDVYNSYPTYDVAVAEVIGMAEGLDGSWDTWWKRRYVGRKLAITSVDPVGTVYQAPDFSFVVMYRDGVHASVHDGALTLQRDFYLKRV